MRHRDGDANFHDGRLIEYGRVWRLHTASVYRNREVVQKSKAAVHESARRPIHPSPSNTLIGTCPPRNSYRVSGSGSLTIRAHGVKAAIDPNLTSSYRQGRVIRFKRKNFCQPARPRRTLRVGSCTQCVKSTATFAPVNAQACQDQMSNGGILSTRSRSP